MAAEQHDLRPLVAALTAALRRSGWYDRASLQDALYGWAASGLSVGEVRAYLAAHPPTYLVVELGQPPTNPDGRAAWVRGARAIERYRASLWCLRSRRSVRRLVWASTVGAARQAARPGPDPYVLG
jgi:hypothetical protein